MIKLNRNILVAGGASLGLALSASAQTFSVLHRFAADGVDGAAAAATLAPANGALYGTTAKGGTNGGGTLFKLDANGAGYAILHHFAPQGNNWFGTDPAADGSCPVGAIAVDGGVIYGATQTGGGGGIGSVYRAAADGSSYSVLHHFLYVNNGQYPGSGLYLTNGWLYGACLFGGQDDRPPYSYQTAGGVQYALQTDGDGYHVRYTFQKYSPNPVVIPAYDLAAVPTNGWGTMTYLGVSLDNGGYGSEMQANMGVNFSGFGGAPYGALYGVTEGATFFHYHSFTGNEDGAYPSGGPLLDGDFGSYKLYGVTIGDGVNTAGTIYSYAIETQEFKILHTFVNDVFTGSQYTNGMGPVGKLVLIGDTLYGVTRRGGKVGPGNDGFGVIYQIKKDGTGFKVLHTFDALQDGGNPVAGLVAVGQTLYGTTTSYGSADNAVSGNGTIFKLALPDAKPLPPGLGFGPITIPSEQIHIQTNSVTGQTIVITNHVWTNGIALKWKLDDGFSHTLLQSPSMKLPLGNWSEVAPDYTNQFEVGKILKPNPVDPQRFYLLKSVQP